MSDKMIRELLNKLYGNLVILTNLPGQRRVSYLPNEKLNAKRDARVRGIVRYASKAVPYYQNLFQKIRIDPSEIKTAEDLDCLPLIDKEEVQKNPDFFVSTSRNGKKSIPFHTSGSRGMPLTVRHDQYSLLANIAFRERERQVISRVCGRELGYSEVIITYPDAISCKAIKFYQKKLFNPLQLKRLFISHSDAVRLVIKAIDNFRPDVIRGFGSYLETLFRLLYLNKTQMHLPKMIIYSADSMTSEGKKLIEEKFGVPVFSNYRAAESFTIGFFCEDRRGFHLYKDLCHLKIVDESGRCVPNGEKGEVVISNLVNRGTVLLNYRLGDIASFLNKKCTCGRTLPLLSEIEGRVEDIIFLPNGEFVHPRAVWQILKGRNGVLQYQLIQHEPQRFELKLVTVDRQSYEHVIDGIVDDLRNLLGESAIIESGNYQEAERQSSGKFRPVMSLCKPDGLV
jgi:phenylacetate-CoA ligase